MPKAGRELGQRFQHESPLVKLRVRDLKSLRVHDLCTVQQDVDIDDPGAVLHTALPSHLQLDVRDAQQQAHGMQFRLSLHHRIEERRLILFVHRRRLVHRRNTCDPEAVRIQFADRGKQFRFTVTHVGAETEIDRPRHWNSPVCHEAFLRGILK